MLDNPSRLTIIQGVLSDKIGAETLYVNKYSAGHSILKETARGSPAFDGTTRVVSSTTIDHIVRKHSLAQIDLLKIDVEGAELSVLKGGLQTLREKRIARMFIEGTDRQVGPVQSMAKELHEFASQEGFHAFAAEPRGLRRVHGSKLLNRQTNVFYLRSALKG